MGSPWKAAADDSRQQMLLILKDGEKTPSEIATHFDFTLPALSTHLKVLRDAGLVSERKKGQNRFYSVNRDSMSEMMQFFDLFWDDLLRSLKEYVQNNKDAKRRKWQKSEKQSFIDAQPEVVFRALTDEKELTHWFLDQVKLEEPRVDGFMQFKFFEDGKENHRVKGKVLEIVPNKKISYSWANKFDPNFPRRQSLGRLKR
jgi:ArsR family transcriptional regulator